MPSGVGIGKGEQRKEDYGYEAEMNLCGVPLRKTNHKGRKRDASAQCH